MAHTGGGAYGGGGYGGRGGYSGGGQGNYQQYSDDGPFGQSNYHQYDQYEDTYRGKSQHRDGASHARGQRPNSATQYGMNQQMPYFHGDQRCSKFLYFIFPTFFSLKILIYLFIHLCRAFQPALPTGPRGGGGGAYNKKGKQGGKDGTDWSQACHRSLLHFLDLDHFAARAASGTFPITPISEQNVRYLTICVC